MDFFTSRKYVTYQLFKAGLGHFAAFLYISQVTQEAAVLAERMWFSWQTAVAQGLAPPFLAV